MRLQEIHAAHPLDVILLTGDLTDAGRSAEWAEFFAAFAAYPQLAELVVALPGNHDVNVVDRASPARMDLPTSPAKRLRQIRTISALGMLQGARLHVMDRRDGRIGDTLADALQPYAVDMAAFADNGSARLRRSLAGLWAAIFPLVLPPDTDDGLGIMVLNSNAETHFSFTNALGLVSAEQARACKIATDQYPRACWIVALHHHVVEYPQEAKELSERIGTALVNGSWFIRRLLHLGARAVIMHGHRHVDWIGECGDSRSYLRRRRSWGRPVTRNPISTCILLPLEQMRGSGCCSPSGSICVGNRSPTIRAVLPQDSSRPACAVIGRASQRFAPRRKWLKPRWRLPVRTATIEPLVGQWRRRGHVIVSQSTARRASATQ